MIKPNLAAPGVNVRSSMPGDGYDVLSGTSMAAPHLAGTVALMWSAAPSLVGRRRGPRGPCSTASAVDTTDLRCGGTPANNNVWGEGRLDAFAAVEASPRVPAGTVAGTVRDAVTGQPLAGVRIQTDGTPPRTASTDSQGHYSMVLAVGTYSLSASLFGYATQTVTDVRVTEGTTVVDFSLTPSRPTPSLAWSATPRALPSLAPRSPWWAPPCHRRSRTRRGNTASSASRRAPIASR